MKTKFTLLLCLWAVGLAAQPPADWVDQALQAHPELRVMESRVSASEARVNTVGYLPNPQLTVSGGVLMQPVETRTGPQMLRLSLSQMFPWFGTLGLERDVQTKRSATEQARLVQRRNEVVLQVHLGWYRLFVRHQEQEKLVSTLALLEESEAIARGRYEAGLERLSALYQLRLQIAEVETRIEDAGQAIQTEKRRLAFQLGLDSLPTYQVPDTLTWAKPDWAQVDWSASPERAVINREQQVVERELEMVGKQGSPSFMLGFDYIFVAERENMNFAGNGRDAYMPMFGVSLPIWRKQYRAARESYRMEQEALQLADSAVLADLEVTTIELQEDYQAAERDLRLLSKQLQLTEQMLTVAREEYAASRLPLEELLRIELEQLALRLAQDRALEKAAAATARYQTLQGHELAKTEN